MHRCLLRVTGWRIADLFSSLASQLCSLYIPNFAVQRLRATPIRRSSVLGQVCGADSA